MSAFVESLGRLFQASRLRLDQLDALRSNGKITEEEYTAITKETNLHEN